jgi:hypothetical protein
MKMNYIQQNLKSINMKLNVMAEWLGLWLCILEFLGSNLGLGISYPDLRFFSYTKSYHANARTVP